VRVLAERQPIIAGALLAFVVLNNALAVGLFLVAYGFDVETLRDGGSLIERGSEVAGLFRVAALLDMLGYLAFAPVVVFLHGRMTTAFAGSRSAAYVPPTLTACGLSFVLLGALGAALLASAGAWLLEVPPSDPTAFAAARIQLGALERAVLIGIWGTLELGLLSIWLFGFGWSLRHESRTFARFTVLTGLGVLAYAVSTGFSGYPPLLRSPGDLILLSGVALFPLWALWFSFRLWRGS